jgi:hypothetical protein
MSPWEDLTVKAEGHRELDDGRILALVRHSGRGKTSGLALEQVHGGAGLFHIGDAKVTRLVAYFDRANALADLGFAPEQDGNEAGGSSLLARRPFQRCTGCGREDTLDGQGKYNSTVRQRGWSNKRFLRMPRIMAFGRAMYTRRRRCARLGRCPRTRMTR